MPGRGPGPQRRLQLGELAGPVSVDLAALGLDAADVPEALGLEGARGVARALHGLAARGQDPVEMLEEDDRRRREEEAEAARRSSTRTRTLGEMLERYIALRESPPEGWKPPKGQKAGALRPSTIAGWRSLASGALAPLADQDPDALSVLDVEQWHQATGESRGKVVANRGLELLQVVYAWGMNTRDSSGRPLLSSSPCGAVRPFEEQSRRRSLDSGELRAVWDALEGEPYGDVVRLLLWTGCRKSEATGAEWREFDFAAKLWTVPAERSKTREARRIPLSGPAAEMLEDRRSATAPEERWVFPSPVGAVGPVGSIQALVLRVRKASSVEDWTIHDFRRVVRSNLSALGVAPPVAEFILGHLPPRLTRTYDRYEPLAEAAAALEAWARRLERYVDPERSAGAEVVPFSPRNAR